MASMVRAITCLPSSAGSLALVAWFEASAGENDDAAAGQQDFMTEFQVHGRLSWETEPVRAYRSLTGVSAVRQRA